MLFINKTEYFEIIIKIKDFKYQHYNFSSSTKLHSHYRTHLTKTFLILWILSLIEFLFFEISMTRWTTMHINSFQDFLNYMSLVVNRTVI